MDMDVHIPIAITEGLRIRGIDVITAQEDDAREMGDSELLDRATSLSRLLVTSDADLLIEADRRQSLGISFAGIVYAHPLRVSIGRCIDDIELIAKTSSLNDYANRVEYLPL